jgi:hypothetical protein
MTQHTPSTDPHTYTKTLDLPGGPFEYSTSKIIAPPALNYAKKIPLLVQEWELCPHPVLQDQDPAVNIGIKHWRSVYDREPKMWKPVKQQWSEWKVSTL